MRFLIQRVLNASVTVDGDLIGSIGRGFLVLIGLGREDNEKTADYYVDKMLKLRIFEDENGKTNRSLSDVGGELLLVSQFTLYADARKGNRPGFTDAMLPAEAERLYEYIIERCRAAGFTVATGSFGADMKVSLVNDGPFTIMLDESILPHKN